MKERVSSNDSVLRVVAVHQAIDESEILLAIDTEVRGRRTRPELGDPRGDFLDSVGRLWMGREPVRDASADRSPPGSAPAWSAGPAHRPDPNPIGGVLAPRRSASSSSSRPFLKNSTPSPDCARPPKPACSARRCRRTSSPSCAPVARVYACTACRAVTCAISIQARRGRPRWSSSSARRWCETREMQFPLMKWGGNWREYALQFHLVVT